MNITFLMKYYLFLGSVDRHEGSRTSRGEGYEHESERRRRAHSREREDRERLRYEHSNHGENSDRSRRTQGYKLEYEPKKFYKSVSDLFLLINRYLLYFYRVNFSSNTRLFNMILRNVIKFYKTLFCACKLLLYLLKQLLQYKTEIFHQIKSLLCL